MIGRLNHVAIVVDNVEKASAIYRGTLGAKVSAPESLAEHGVTVVFVELPNTKIELLEPYGENSPIAGFAAKNPSGGIHHVCYEVDDIKAARDKLTKLGEYRVAVTRDLEDAEVKLTSVWRLSRYC